MGSQAPISLPVIDFSEISLIKPGTDGWNSLKSQVVNALEEYGFFKALYKLPEELEIAIFDELKELFDQHKSSSHDVEALKKPFAYVKLQGSRPFESIGVGNPLDMESLENLAKDLWPEGRPSFSNSIQGFGKEVMELEKPVRRMVVESLGIEKYLDEAEYKYGVRVMKYEKPQSSEAEVGLGAHLDHNLITILHQNQVDGLELQTRGGEWISAHLCPDSFIVLAGESFHAWTNGRIHTPYHRVTVKGKEERYSIGLFASFSNGHVIESPKELVNEHHPPLFKPFKYGDYIQFVQKNLGKGPATTLAAFFGV